MRSNPLFAGIPALKQVYRVFKCIDGQFVYQGEEVW